MITFISIFNLEGFTMNKSLSIKFLGFLVFISLTLFGKECEVKIDSIKLTAKERVILSFSPAMPDFVDVAIKYTTNCIKKKSDIKLDLTPQVGKMIPDGISVKKYNELFEKYKEKATFSKKSIHSVSKKISIEKGTHQFIFKNVPIIKLYEKIDNSLWYWAMKFKITLSVDPKKQIHAEKTVSSHIVQ